jgi:ornithine carbamoyltransferase
MKHLTRIIDLSTEEITSILNLADNLKVQFKNYNFVPYLDGLTLGMIFEKSSTRTRVSFEAGMHYLGGQAIFLSSNDIQLGRGEPIKDTIRVLSRYIDALMIRTFAQSNIDELTKYTSIPIINGLSDDSHPCQVLADLMTIREKKKTLEGIKICFVGDGSSNMANSLTVGALKTGMTMAIATPKGYQPHPEVMAFARDYPNFTITDDVIQAVTDADVVYTDVFTSMGQEKEKEDRLNAMKEFQVNSALLKHAKADAMVLHCLPAHRDEEITDEVLEAHADEIFEQAENRMHAQNSVLVLLMEDSKKKSLKKYGHEYELKANYHFGDNNE